jgi:hypothetical protein
MWHHTLCTPVGPALYVTPVQMTVLVFGGQRKGFDCPRTLPESLETLAGRASYRINITWDGPGNGTSQAANT